MSCPHPGGPAVHLEALRRELAGRGWITSLLESPGRPSSLFVQNPDPGASALNDHVLVADDSGVTVVDAALAGLHGQLDEGLELLGRSREDVRAFILTHGDADHVGVAAKLQHDGDAAVADGHAEQQIERRHVA